MHKFKDKNNNIKNDDIINNDIVNNDVKISFDENNKMFITHKKKKNDKKISNEEELFDINYDFIEKMNNVNTNETNINETNVTTNKIKNDIKKNTFNEINDLLNLDFKSNSISRNRSSSLSLSSHDNKNEIKNNNKKNEDKNIFFTELLKKQIVGIPSDKKLTYNDIKRISKFIKSSIFDKKKCSIWNGYITNENNNLKGTYINFYFNKKKIALHRLLYINYIGTLSDNEYLKFSCENKGKCCNIHHMKKYTYNSVKNETLLKNNSENVSLNKCNIQTQIKLNTNSNSNSTQTHNQNLNDCMESVQINVDKKKLIVEI